MGNLANYPNERVARAVVEELLSPYFWLFPEVHLRYYTGERLRIDYVAKPRGPFPVPFIGIEVKRGYGAFRDFTHALKQAQDYRHATLIDRRAKSAPGGRLPFVFVFPRPVTHEAWVAGVERFVGLDNVGLISIEEYAGVTLRVSADRFWSSAYGLRADAHHWGQRRPVGSR